MGAPRPPETQNINKHEQVPPRERQEPPTAFKEAYGSGSRNYSTSANGVFPEFVFVACVLQFSLHYYCLEPFCRSRGGLRELPERLREAVCAATSGDPSREPPKLSNVMGVLVYVSLFRECL